LSEAVAKAPQTHDAVAIGAHRLDRGIELVSVHRSPRRFRVDLPPGQTQSAQSCPLCSLGGLRGVEQCSWACQVARAPAT
jgi:hypothetical protein